ncbi:hypothetical protein B0J17DRAFT_678303 [Rhizoctonia solani]|nr:hypothetical protein B0J17DRAFT_678303 [Rhizoctonia solani]
MLDQLKSAGDQLSVAWDNYYRVCSNLENLRIKKKPHTAYSLPIVACRLLDTQLTLMSSYESKIQEAKLKVRHARNYSLRLAPINCLPPEILTRIFHLVRKHPCDLYQSSSSNKKCYPGYPDYLAQVCSLWRKTALSSHSLWCHIDLSSHESWCAGLVSRVETYVARAGELPVELHVSAHEGWDTTPSDNKYEDLSRILSLISNRVESLEFAIGTFGGFSRAVFRGLLLRRPPTLTKLILRSEIDRSNVFIVPDPTQPIERGEGLALGLPENQLESSLAPLTTLHLCGIFPLWSSTAYHGLVDLRLLSTRGWSFIEETELIIILKSSPRLRILHFDLEVHNSTPRTNSEGQVQLRDLQVIKIFPHYSDPRWCPSNILQLLAPGTKPLQLSLKGYHGSNDVLVMNLGKLFARSRVARFYSNATCQPTHLLRHAPHLEHVIFDCSRYDTRGYIYFNEPSFFFSMRMIGLLSRLRSLHLVGWILSDDELRSLVDHRVNGIALYSCDIHGRNSGGTFKLSIRKLLESFPTVEISERNPYSLIDPVNDWDILD